MCHRLEIGQNMFKGLTISSMITRNKFISSNNILQEKKYFHKVLNSVLKIWNQFTINFKLLEILQTIRKITWDQLWWPKKTCIYLIELLTSYLVELSFNRQSKRKSIWNFSLIWFWSHSILVLFHYSLIPFLSYFISALFRFSLFRVWCNFILILFNFSLIQFWSHSILVLFFYFHSDE